MHGKKVKSRLETSWYDSLMSSSMRPASPKARLSTTEWKRVPARPASGPALKHGWKKGWIML